MLGALGALAPAQLPSLFPSPELERHELNLEGDKQIARKSLLLVPKHVAEGTKLPLVVLCHGLGETDNEAMAMKAWSELYGLVRCYERLRRPPVERTLKGAKYLTDAALDQLNRELSARPFSGMVLACPVTPNTNRLPPGSTLDRYANWIETKLLPAIRERAPVLPQAESTGIDGVSLGGYAALEVFLRKPNLFGAVGSCQGAFSLAAADKYAARIETVIRELGPRKVRIATSSEDPFRKPAERLAKALSKRDIAHTLSLTPGPHNQHWLREIGSLELLLFHDRALARTANGVSR
jgi:predicted esterase